MKLLVIVFFLYTSLPLLAGTPAFKAKEGSLDLSSYKFNSHQPIVLDGEWNLYKGVFDSLPSADGNRYSIKVPGAWTPGLKQFKSPSYGFGTYYLQIIVGDTAKIWALNLPPIHSAYKLFINGTLISSIGKPGNNGTETPQVESAIIHFYVPGRTINIAIQVSNYSFVMGGMSSSIALGSSKAINRYRQNSITTSGLLIGSLLIMSLYHLCLFILWRKDTGFLYFSIVCFFIALREAFARDAIFFFLFQNLPHAITLKILYLCFPAGLCAFILFFKNIYISFNNLIKNIAVLICATYALAILITPNIVYARFLPIPGIVFISVFFYLTWLVIKNALISFKKNLLVIIGLFVILIAIINDFLHEAHYVNTGFFLPFAFFIFTLFHAVLLSIRFTNAFKRSETLSLKVANQKIEYLEMETNYQQEVQRSKIEMQEETLTHISREIHDNIGATLTLAKLNLYRKNSISKPEILQDTINLITQALRDLRDLSHSLNTDQIEKLGFVNAVKKELQLFESRSGIAVQFQMSGESPELGSKKELLLFRVVQESLTNVVKHAKASQIHIIINSSNQALSITIKDNGVGFNTELSSGNGMINIKSRCELLKADLDIQSAPIHGTTLKILIKPSASEV